MTGSMMLTVAQVPPDGREEFQRYEEIALRPLAEHGARLDRRVRSAGGELEVCLLGFPSRAAVEAYDAEFLRLTAAAPDTGSRLRLLRLPLELEHGPRRIRLWRCLGELPVCLMLENDETLDEVDLLLVAEVLTDLDRHLDAARRFAQDALGAAHPLHDPELTFYPDDEWLLRFAEGHPDPYGVTVMFRRHEPVRLEDLDEWEEIIE